MKDEVRKLYFDIFKHLILVSITLMSAIGGSIIFNLYEISEFMMKAYGDSGREELLKIFKAMAAILFVLLLSFSSSLVGMFLMVKNKAESGVISAIEISVGSLVFISFMVIIQLFTIFWL